MSSSKKQQSFSSYSEEQYNGKEIQDEDGFSEYQEEKESPKVKEQSGVRKAQKVNLLRQRRRYSYGGNLEQKPITYNYLDPLNDIPNTRGTYYTAALKPRQPKFINFAGSPCGLGIPFTNTSLFQYQQCYLSGLDKYYKSHNYNKRHQNRLSVASSVERNKSVEKALDRSEYWNGEKFDYLKEKPGFQDDGNKKDKVGTFKQSKDHKKVQFERNLTSGLIVNKKQLKESKANKPHKLKHDTSNYIKIEQDSSNTKHASQAKIPLLQKPIIQLVKKDRQVLMQRSVKQNVDTVQKPKETDLKFQPIQVRTKEAILMEQEYSFLLAEKNQLSAENQKLKEIIKNKDIEIQALAKQRIIDNDDYKGNIEKLKKIFESQRNEMIKQFQSEISIYKSVRKEVIKSQLVKEETEKIALIAEKNKLQDEVKRITDQFINLQKELQQKNYKIKLLEEKVSNSQNQFNLKNQNRIQPKNATFEKEKILIRGPNKKQEPLKPKEVIPEWINNFLSVFKNMVIKLLGSVEPSWSEKKTIIIGWKVVKIMIEKAVKIGIKVPEIINDDQIGECSLISHPEKSTENIKKPNLPGSKKPIRV